MRRRDNMVKKNPYQKGGNRVYSNDRISYSSKSKNCFDKSHKVKIFEKKQKEQMFDKSFN